MNITYIILLKTQEKNIAELAKSLKAVRGNFRAEYIIIDDYSEDNTKATAVEAFGSLPRTTIISNDAYYGPAYSINKALKIATGQYIHFIDGDEILAPHATSALLQACDTMGTSVALGLYGAIEGGNKFNSPYDTGDIVLVDAPIKSLLENVAPDIRRFGNSGTLVSKALLDQIGGANENVFLSNMSLGMKCAKYTKFALLKKTVCYSYQTIESRYSKEFEAYNDLSAIVDFMENHKAVAEQYTQELYKALWSTLWHVGNKYKMHTLPRYFLSKYVKNKLGCDGLIELYKGYIAELEW